MADGVGAGRATFIESRIVQKRRNLAAALLAITAVPSGVQVPTGSLQLTGFPPTITVSGAEGPRGYEHPKFCDATRVQPRRNLAALYQAIISAPTAGPTVAVPSAVLNILGFAPTITQATPVFVGQDLQGERDAEYWQPPRKYQLHALQAPGSITVPVETASLLLTGFPPDITISGGPFVPTGTLTLTGFPPTITQQFSGRVDVDVGQMAMTGFAPEIAISGQIIIPTGTLTLIGFPPIISFGAAPTATRFTARKERKRFKPI